MLLQCGGASGAGGVGGPLTTGADLDGAQAALSAGGAAPAPRAAPTPTSARTTNMTVIWHVYAVASTGTTAKTCAATSSALLPNRLQSGAQAMGRSAPRAPAAATSATVTAAQTTTAVRPR